MWRSLGFLTLVCTMLLFTIFRSPVLARPVKDDVDKNEGKVLAGILFDKKDNWLTVKADGDEAPVKYLINKDDKILAAKLKNIFNAGRVQFKYKKDGDDKQLVDIGRQVLRAQGSITGTVVALHNDFWVEVKPKEGVADAFAPGANYNDKAFMAKLKALKPGDSVTIQYTTDGERHRILAMKLNDPPKDK